VSITSRVDRLLDHGIEVLDADTHAVEANGAQCPDFLEIHGAGIDFNGVFPAVIMQ
jgi:hypothetical protein